MTLSRQLVIDEAMRLIDAEGLDALSLRRLASRLHVQAPTLYWHVRNKAELLDALADAIMDDVLAAIPALDAGEEWREWLLTAVSELRRAMLAHPDGARIISAARDSLRRADFSERAMATLVAQGVELQRARMTVLAVERFTVGHVLEEESLDRGGDSRGVDPDELMRRLPTATRAIVEYFASGRTADDVYRDGVRLILGLPPLL
ncbi:MAG TPA: TetR/AcrR family transcriptional regulator C-terminal domain-containing protein [Humibacter sp.]|jgi:TetR/AcrR family tetracycline transcriptional repressor|nr:TetR/AcrR family transcriptional regulator C-terminal domain-containing protein [Humibacter sp.]